MLPSFLGIGAQRAGTTRLHQVLAAHPGIIMPTQGADPFRKELRYFNSYVLKHDLDWYEQRFRPQPGQQTSICGEITPAYAILPTPVVSRIKQLMPALRLVFIIRNPVDRIWSQILMQLSRWGYRKGDVVLPPEQELVRLVERPNVILRTDYARTIDIWSKVFGRDALHVVVFEEQFANHQSSLKEILRHIGADPCWTAPEVITGPKVWSAPAVDCPDFLRVYLARKWYRSVVALDKRLDGRLHSWIDQMTMQTNGYGRKHFVLGHYYSARCSVSKVREYAVIFGQMKRISRRLAELVKTREESGRLQGRGARPVAPQ